MSFLCVIVITGCKELISFSSCISLLFRPAAIIFMAQITFSLSLTKFWGVRKQSIFPDTTTDFLWNDVRGSTTEISSIMMTCHCPDLDSDTSAVWNFWAPSSDFISRGNQWYRREMSAVLSGDQFLRLVSIRTISLFSIKVILTLKFWITRFWITAHLPLP